MVRVWECACGRRFDVQDLYWTTLNKPRCECGRRLPDGCWPLPLRLQPPPLPAPSLVRAPVPGAGGVGDEEVAV